MGFGTISNRVTPDREHIHRARTGLVNYGDYNYLTPKIPQGKSVNEGPNFDLQRYDYLGRYTIRVLGQQRGCPNTRWTAHQIEAASIASISACVFTQVSTVITSV